MSSHILLPRSPPPMLVFGPLASSSKSLGTPVFRPLVFRQTIEIYNPHLSKREILCVGKRQNIEWRFTLISDMVHHAVSDFRIGRNSLIILYCKPGITPVCLTSISTRVCLVCSVVWWIECSADRQDIRASSHTSPVNTVNPLFPRAAGLMHCVRLFG